MRRVRKPAAALAALPTRTHLVAHPALNRPAGHHLPAQRRLAGNNLVNFASRLLAGRASCAATTGTGLQHSSLAQCPGHRQWPRRAALRHQLVGVVQLIRVRLLPCVHRAWATTRLGDTGSRLREASIELHFVFVWPKTLAWGQLSRGSSQIRKRAQRLWVKHMEALLAR